MSRRNQLGNVVSYGVLPTDNPPPSPPTMYYDYPPTPAQYHPMYMYPGQAPPPGSLDMMHPAIAYQYQYPYPSKSAAQQTNSFTPSMTYYYPSFYPHQLQPPATFSSLGTTRSFDLSKPRGPPRKPKQTGHAIWVGNLPPLTYLEDLLRLFGNADIVSIFLIQKTNCAFVNYATQDAVKQVLRTMTKFNMRGRILLIKEQDHSESSREDETCDESEEPYEVPDIDPKNRYFICKSLTVEDLEVSTTLGIWSTQRHIEATLNKAFKSAENVYIIFSANKTGEFFGYARMTSASKPRSNSKNTLNKNQKGELGNWPRNSPPLSDSSWSTLSNPLDQLLYHEPRTTVTPADPSIPIPAGRIVDDSSRGTLFWEYIPVESEQSASFDIEWINTHPVQFKDVMHLRNRFNMNKPLKVAKDGTEIEPDVGARLLALFPQ